MVDQDSAMDPMSETPIGPAVTEVSTPAYTANAIDVCHWLAMVSTTAGVPEHVEVESRTRTICVRVAPEHFAPWRTLVGAVQQPTITDVLGTTTMAYSAVPDRWILLLSSHIRAGGA